MHYTIPQLRALDRQYPTQRKLLLVPSVNFGRELLAALAQRSLGSWIGWEPATLGTIADKLAVVGLARRRLRRASDVATDDAVNAAFEQAIAAGETATVLARLAWNAGTRSAITDAVLELRMAGVSPDSLLACQDSTSPIDDGAPGTLTSLAAILRRYESLLSTRGLADTRTVFDVALKDFDGESKFVLDHALLVATPGWEVRGAQKQLLDQLVALGLRSLTPLRIQHLERPEGLMEDFAAALDVTGEVELPNSSATIFYAGTTADELREVMRRSLAKEAGFDDIEVACTDRDEHGQILETLCAQLGANITSLDGYRLNATRTGRALEHWLSWIESDYTADHIRRALEAGDWLWPLETSDRDPSPLTAELRRLRIGWGLEATRRAALKLEKSTGHKLIVPSEEESDEAFEARIAAREAAGARLGGLLSFLIQLAPHQQPDGSLLAEISVAELAARTLEVMKLFVPHGPAERSTLARLADRLRQIQSIPRGKVAIPYAIATLRQELASLRAWTATSNTARPRRSTGGHIHLTSIENAGATCRPLLFLVGLDADRTAGPVLQSPLLPEWLRNRLNERGAGLATIEQRRRERAWQLALAIKGSSAVVTLSYALQNGNEGRENSPSAALLHAARESFGEPALNYDDLPRLLGQPASAIPQSKGAALDKRDVMLSHVARGPLLLDATNLAREIFPTLDRGLRAEAERAAQEVGAFHGLVPAAGRLDPRHSSKPVSPSSLESLAGCSLRWFYTYALEARLAEEPEYDPMQWLNVLDRGTALHRVYERIIQSRVHEIADAAERARKVSEIVQKTARDTEYRVPVSSEIVRDREVAALERDSQFFANAEHESFTEEPWTTIALELPFGDERAAAFPLDDGSVIHVHGRIDRVDRLRDGSLRLVDYKTGKAFQLDTKRGTFDGGRKLQLAVYSPAISRHFDAAVSVAEYRFPTERGEGMTASAQEEMLRAAPAIVRSMMDDVAAGRFLPTVDESDCTYCSYAVICRTSVDEYRKTTSPRAEWAKLNVEKSPHFVGIRVRRQSGGDAE